MKASPVPTFEKFYLATNGRKPFPWQTRLAQRVVTSGWPTSIGVPTGLGKTACIDIAVWALAGEAHLAPTARRLPTRVWYVVNRRLLVDAGADRAELLARWINDPSTLAEAEHAVGWTTQRKADAIETMTLVSDALQSRTDLRNIDGPLHASRLRGGFAERQLPVSPSQPAVISATVPMFGSRLLFRGYGGGRYTRSIETALASVDSLVLLDEAHLSRPLQTLVDQLTQADATTTELLGPTRSHPTLVALTATGEGDVDRFDLDDDDLAHPVVRQRLDASKPTRLAPTTTKKLSGALADAVLTELNQRSEPGAAIVFTNSAKRALELSELLERRLKHGSQPIELTTLTGRMRAPDAEAARDSLLTGSQRLTSGRERNELSQHRIVVATQTLEVGADLDFDILVTETAGIRALVQRFGRLNRLGEVTTAATAVVVHPVDAPDTGLYGTEPAVVWDRLSTAGALDLTPATISETLGRSTERGPRTPELLPNHLDEYAKTTTTPVGEAPVELFFDGIDESQPRARVQVAWRAYLPAAEEETATPVASSRLVVPRINEGELVEIPLRELIELIEDRNLDEVDRLSSDRLGLERVPLRAIAPGDQVILPVAVGGYVSHRGWTPQSVVPVADRSDLGGQLLLHPGVVGSLLMRQGADPLTTTLVGAALAALNSGDTVEARKVAKAALDGDPSIVEEPTVEVASVLDTRQALVDGFEQVLIAIDDDLSLEGREAWGPGRDLAEIVATWLHRLGVTSALSSTLRCPDGSVWVLGDTRRDRITWGSPADDSLDELSHTGDGSELAQHLVDTGARAEQLAREVGLPEALVTATRNAGRLHDLGKADRRFQRWLGADQGALRAKSNQSSTSDWQTLRVQSGWPRGGRHETLSVRIAIELVDQLQLHALLEPDADLVLHLIASHHGRGRPGLFGVPDDNGAEINVPAAVVGEVVPIDGDREVTVDGDLSSTDWDQPVRFHQANQRYGRRGVALLEAVLRQADWIESARSSRTVTGGIA